MRFSVVGPAVGVALFFASAAVAQTEGQRCERGDRRACHRLGQAASADGGTREVTRAWVWLGRACELGEPDACDDAARLARSQQKWMAADSFEEEARRLRSADAGPYLPPDAGPTAEQDCERGD